MHGHFSTYAKAVFIIMRYNFLDFLHNQTVIKRSKMQVSA